MGTVDHSAAKEASENFRGADMLRFIKGARIRAVLSLLLTISAWGGVAFASLYYLIDCGHYWRFGISALCGASGVIRHDVLIDANPLDQGGTACFVLSVWFVVVLLSLLMVSLRWILRKRSQMTRRIVGWFLAVWQIPVIGFIFLFYWETARFVAVYGVGRWYSAAFRSMFVGGLVFLMELMSLLMPKPKGWRFWRWGALLLLLCAAIQAVAVVGIFAGARRALAMHPKPTKILPVVYDIDGCEQDRTPKSVPVGRFWGLGRLVLGPQETDVGR